MTSDILVNTDLGNGLLPDGTRPLSEPVLAHHRTPIDKMAAISQTAFSDAFSGIKMSEFRLEFH